MSTELTTTSKPHPYNLPPLFGGLTLKQNFFVDNWLRTQNGVESARLAGFEGEYAVLAATASRLLRSAKVQLEIKRRLGISVAPASEVLETLTAHMRGDLAAVLDEDGNLDLRLARKRGTSKLLKKIKKRTRTDKDGTVTVEQEYEIHDPQAAAEKMGRFHKLFVERVETETTLQVGSDLAELLASVASIAHEQRLSEHEAALRLAAQLADVPELAAMLREWAEGEQARRSLVQPDVATTTPTSHKG